VSVGSRGYSEDGEFVFVKAGAAFPASGSVGPVCSASDLEDCVTGDSDTGAFVGIADAPFASGEYGYVRTKGPATVVVESGALAGGLLQLSATAGKLKALTTSGVAVAVAEADSDDAALDPIAVRVLGGS
jgi:hypothetical protein